MIATCVYLIAEPEDGPKKIGMSENPDGRLRQLQIGNPRRLSLVKTWILPSRKSAQRLEAELHENFSPDDLEGEWFDLREAPLVKFIDWYVIGHLRTPD